MVSTDDLYSHIIDGKQCTSDTFRAVINPADRSIVARVPIATPEQLDACVNAAARAFPAWAATSLEKRQSALRRLTALLEEHRTELAELLTKEQGKPLSVSNMEIGRSAGQLATFSLQSLPDEVVEEADCIFTTRYHPFGVCAAIVPWNFPLALLTLKIAPALVTGNVIIVKPSPFTPLASIKFVQLAQQVLPAGVLSILSGDDDLGPWMTNHPGISRVTFTGSSATGKRVMASAAKNLQRVTLELGGNDPAIIMPDVDPKAVAQSLFWTMFANSGQVCVATKRVYAHESIYDQLRDELVAIAGTVKIGNGMDKDSMLGPLQNVMQYERIKGILDDCKARGLKMAIGGEVDPNAPGYFVPITLVDNPPEDSRIVKEEQFGPVAPLLKWAHEDDVIHRANDTEYGLAASIWSRDVTAANRIAQQLDVGHVWINDYLRTNPAVPIGGHKMSGLGVELGKAGLASWTNTHVTVTPKSQN